MSDHQQQQQQQQHIQEQRASMMVLTIVVMFFTCHILAVVTRWWEVVAPQFFLPSQSQQHPSSGLVQELSNLLVNCNSAANPFIYCFFTRMFRDFYVQMQHQSVPLVITSLGKATSSPNTVTTQGKSHL